MRIYTLEVDGVTVTVDDEGIWKIIANPNQLNEEMLLTFLYDARASSSMATFPPGMTYVRAAVEEMDAKLISIDPPFEFDPNMVY